MMFICTSIFSDSFLVLDAVDEAKQAGTGPSPRHIQGSKIVKRLPSVKYSFTVLENRKFFEKKFSKKLHTQKNGPSGALKSHNAEKLKGGTLWDFSTSILSQNFKKLQGEPFGEFFSKKSLAVPKKNERGGGAFGLARYGMLRGKTGKTVLVQFARPNSAIWCNNIL